MQPQPPPLSLYVHLPWCVRKCPYCDFNSHVAPQDMPQHDYVDALLADLDHDLARTGGRPLISIFFGGGTPSLFTPQEIARFIEGVRARLACCDDMEVTLEANPGTIEHGRFRGYRDAGVTRVSLGAQTFDPLQLRTLGRIHNSDDIARAVDELVQAGLHNFNLDLMYALPQQTLAQALADIEAAIALGPTHISHYQLTLEPGTVFYHRPPPLPDHDLSWEMQLECQALLATHGYEQYEVSAYARSGSRCRHNLNYWQFGDYLGLGAGAHGKLTHGGTIERTVRCKQPRDYLGRKVEERLVERRVVGSEVMFEYMLNALRLIEGFDSAQLQQRTGVPFSAVEPMLKQAQHKGMLTPTESNAGYRPTELGARFLNDLQGMFLPESTG
ncbi:MAG TPA: radical SAM family heme chaperone HemW [Povalibacter sp.]|nr:radical SAM family heme chaperone HemW [Povalibacter sp.]